jgi:vacuolar-type H+-ATPase subunit I/STV1
MNYNIYKQKDKYDTLYSKYLNLLNDFKYLNNNKSNEKSVNKIKKKYNSLLEENKNLKSKLKSKNKIIKNQQKEISDIKELYSKRQSNINNEEEKEIIKNLREESETFRKDLVLSQAMVNSLKAEIEALKKSNNTSKIIKNANKRNQTMNKNNNLFDKYNFTFIIIIIRILLYHKKII